MIITFRTKFRPIPICHAELVSASKK